MLYVKSAFASVELPDAVRSLVERELALVSAVLAVHREWVVRP